MPPIGDYPAGSNEAGYDEITQSVRGPRVLGQASKFSPLERVYILTTDLGLEYLHPVMHRVAHLLGLPLGGLPSSPDEGFDVEAVRNATKVTAQTTCEDAVARALKPLLEAGDIEIVRVLAIVVPSWRGQLETDVRNLRERGSNPVTFRTGAR